MSYVGIILTCEELLHTRPEPGLCWACGADHVLSCLGSARELPGADVVLFEQQRERSLPFAYHQCISSVLGLATVQLKSSGSSKGCPFRVLCSMKRGHPFASEVSGCK